MSKERKQLIILIIVLLLVIGGYAGLRLYNQKQEATAGKEEVTYELIPASELEINQFAFTNENGTFDFTKNGDDWSYVEDEKINVDASIIESMIDKAKTLESDVKIENVTDLAQYGLEDPSRSVTLQAADDLYHIAFGDYNDTIGAYYIMVNEEPVVYTVDSATYSVFGKNIEDCTMTETETETAAEE